MSLYELQNVSMTYHTRKTTPVEALKNVSLSIEPGISYAITGESGSGKSTMLNIMAGLLTPTKGKCFLEGQELTGLSDGKLCRVRNEKLGIVVQDFALLEQSTVLDNCMLPAVIAGTSAKEARQRALSMLEGMELSELAKKKACHLSGGQRQRVAIIRSLMNHPALILADEPTGALDSENGEKIMQLLVKETERGAALVLVTHNVSYAALCQRHFHLKDGVMDTAQTA